MVKMECDDNITPERWSREGKFIIYVQNLRSSYLHERYILGTAFRIFSLLEHASAISNYSTVCIIRNI